MFLGELFQHAADRCILFRPHLDPFILRNWNLLNRVGYLSWNVEFHNFLKYIYKLILNSWGWEMEIDSIDPHVMFLMYNL
jgi:hypothetical protein